MQLKLVIPYGRAVAQHHLAYAVEEGDVTRCGRNCYGWSILRTVEAADLESPYTCQRCLKVKA